MKLSLLSLLLIVQVTEPGTELRGTLVTIRTSVSVGDSLLNTCRNTLESNVSVSEFSEQVTVDGAPLDTLAIRNIPIVLSEGFNPPNWQLLVEMDGGAIRAKIMV